MSSKNSDIAKGKPHTQYMNNKSSSSYATTDVLNFVTMTTGVCHDMTQYGLTEYYLRVGET
jgi:hypothetical protein